VTSELGNEVASIVPRVVGWRRQIHQHPELAFEERGTSALVERELGALDLDLIRTGLASTGVAGLLKGTATRARDESVLLLRADMDALPIHEETGLSFASVRPGVMHACGHDAHTAMLLGAARVLSGLRARLASDVLFMFQPAEEVGSGARAMLDDGLFEVARPDAAYMLHVWHDLPRGTVAIPTGPVMAGALTFHIEVEGRGGHAARPHMALDPVVAAAEIVTMLQLLVSREVDPAQPAVVTIGSIKAGDAANVIPSRASILGTARAYDAGILALLQ
jgi:amidohydrolase